MEEYIDKGENDSYGLNIYLFAVFYPLTMTVIKGRPINTKGLKNKKIRKESEGKVENNKSDEHMVHKLNIVSDYGKKNNINIISDSTIYL